MLDLYISNKNALTGLESALRIAISNANNFNTPGYKYVHASFTTMYSEAITSGTESTNPVVLGQGMTLGSTSTDFSQGPISSGTATDAAIMGEGFFILSTGANEQALNTSANYYTRSGRFQTDAANEYMVDDFGRKVFGYQTDKAGNVISSKLEPIQTGGYTDVSFTEGGILVANEGSDNEVHLFQLALTTFQNKEGLVPVSGAAFSQTVASGERLEPSVAGNPIGGDGSAIYGDVLGGSLESSNVDIPRVALDMNILNRSYTATQGVIDDVTKVFNETMKVLK